MEFLLVAVLVGIIPAVIAHKKGRSFFGWWLFGAALFIIALPTALLIGPSQASMKQCRACTRWVPIGATRCEHCGGSFDAATRPVVTSGVINAEENEGFKDCPRCAERVRAKAKVCRFCGHEFEAVGVGTDEVVGGDGVRRLRRSSDWQA